MIRSALIQRATAGGRAPLLRALLLSPLGAYLSVLAACLAEEALESPADVGVTLLVASTLGLLVFMLAWPLLAALAALLGLPVHLLLTALGLRRWLAYGIAGAAAGAGFAMTALLPLLGLIFDLPPQSEAVRNPADLALVGGVAGLGSALAFWAVLRPHRERAETAALNP